MASLFILERTWKMEEIVANVGTLASFIGSLTVVGSALIWIYNKFIGAPREKRREREESRRHEKMLKLVSRENEPLSNSIDDLNKLLKESKLDRENLNRVTREHSSTLDDHTQRLDSHNGRLIALETKNGITTVKYKEKHGGDNQ